MTRVVIADDQALVRGGFRIMIDAAPDMHVVAEASDGASAVRLTQQHHPDVVLMDIRMPGVDGIEATRLITDDGQSPGTRVLILTTFDLDEYVYRALQAGASGFLLKDTSPEDLLAGIRMVAAGEALLAPSVTRRLIAEFVRRPPGGIPEGPDHKSVTALNLLTDREREVLVEVARGYSNTEIGDRLHMSAATAKTHVSRLLTKLQARDRTQLVVLAYETGLVGQSGNPPGWATTLEPPT